jgi:hypothetical protein
MPASDDNRPFSVEAEDETIASPYFGGRLKKFVRITCKEGEKPYTIGVLIADGGSEEANKALAVDEGRRVAASLGLGKPTPLT